MKFEPRERDQYRDQRQARDSSRMRPSNRLGQGEIPDLPDDVTISDLPGPYRDKLKGLGKENAAYVGRHLVMVLGTLEDDPELAYRHARAAADRAARVDLVREYAGLTSYFTGRYAEAIRELRTYQRLSASPHHVEIIADSLRGVGKPLEAVDLATSADTSKLDPDERVELGIVLAGARADLGDFDAALAVLSALERAEGASGRIAEARQGIQELKASAKETR
jgi:tetratricopeptide (TPR) repeat protein